MSAEFVILVPHPSRRSVLTTDDGALPGWLLMYDHGRLLVGLLRRRHSHRGDRCPSPGATPTGDRPGLVDIEHLF